MGEGCERCKVGGTGEERKGDGKDVKLEAQGEGGDVTDAK